MQDSKYSQLSDRGVVRIAGPDVKILIEKLITNSLTSMTPNNAIHTGLLSPQGKILFDFFIKWSENDLIIDIARSYIDEFIKRLTIYKLRSNVTFEDSSGSLVVVAAWNLDANNFGHDIISYKDPRLPELGYRLILPIKRLPELAGKYVSEDEYHAHRTIIGIPEAGRDYKIGATFPHEALYDQLDSVDFTKGCYIGQEVVSRMQHRGSARKRIVPVSGDKSLTSNTEITADGINIGSIKSVTKNRGLALVRLDLAHEAKLKNVCLMADSAILTLEQRSWLRLDMSTGRSLDK
ncbi:MAG: tRNA-modifying protein YgfZ [Hyphomicrobiaceae bacterium hypho_1]